MVMCFVPDCKHYSEQGICKFFVFPAKKEERKAWILLIRRQDREPSQHSLVCSCHFMNNDRKNRPTIFGFSAKRKFAFTSPEKKVPSDAEKRKIWLALIGVPFLPKAAVICSDHFEPESYIIRKDGRHWLKAESNPKLVRSDNTSSHSSDSSIIEPFFETPPRKESSCGSENVAGPSGLKDMEEVKHEPTDIPHMMQQVTSHQNISGFPKIVSYGTCSEESFQPHAKQESESIAVTASNPPVTPAEREAAESHNKKTSFIIKRTLEKNSIKLKAVRSRNIKLKRKIVRVKRLLDNLVAKGDISAVTQQILNGPSNIIPVVNDSCTESETEPTQDSLDSETENIKIEIVDDDIPKNYAESLETNNQDVIAVDDDEEELTHINSFNTESQVQITFLTGTDAAKEGLLKRKLKQLAESDIVKSKKIRELNNIIFVKNKVINELRSEIEKLKENNQKRINV